MMKGYSLVIWRVRKKKMAVVLWKKWQERLLALYEEKDALPPAVTICATIHPASVRQIVMATAATEWLHALPFMMSESQNMRKSEARHAVISN